MFSEKEEQILSYLQSEKKKIPLILVNPGGTEEKTIRVWFDVQDMAECLAEKIHQKRQVACVVDICHHRFRLSLLYLLHLFQKQKGASVLARRAEGEIVFEEAEVKLVRPGAGGTGGGGLSRRRRNAAPG